MEILALSGDAVDRHRPEDLDTLLAENALVWVDVPSWDDATATELTDRFGIHPRAVADCARRNPIPKVHVHPGHVFVVLHAPERGARGHVHYVELDQFVGPNWLITVHGPVNPAVPPEVAFQETGAVARRLETGRLHPRTAPDLCFALAPALTGRLRDLLSALTEEV